MLLIPNKYYLPKFGKYYKYSRYVFVSNRYSGVCSHANFYLGN